VQPIATRRGRFANRPYQHPRLYPTLMND
jgi:hypothetical protein